jgi:hypothetical protein
MFCSKEGNMNVKIHPMCKNHGRIHRIFGICSRTQNYRKVACKTVCWVQIRNEFRDSDASLHPQKEIKYYAIQSFGIYVYNDLAGNRRTHGNKYLSE